MKKQAKLLLLILVAVAVLCSTLVITMATSAAADDPAYSIYLADPSAGNVTPDYSGSDDLFTKLYSYTELGSDGKTYYVMKDVWVKLHKDVTLNCTAPLRFLGSAYFDLNNKTLTMNNGTSDNCLTPLGSNGKVLEIKNGNLTTSSKNKIAYSYSGSTHISFNKVNITPAFDCFDMRSNGKLTLNECTVNYVTSVGNANRFVATANAGGTVTIDIVGTTFNVGKGFHWAANVGSLFFLNHSKGNSNTVLNVSDSFINVEDGSDLWSVFQTGNYCIATINVENTQIDTVKPLMYFNSNSNGGKTVFNWEEGLAVNPASVTNSVFSGSANRTINYAAGDNLVQAYVNGELVEYVAPENAVTVTYYYDGQELGSRLSKIGSEPVWDLQFDGGDTFVDGVLYYNPTGGVYYSDAEQTDRVKKITAETDTLFVAPGKGTPYVWAAFYDTPSLETLIDCSKDSAEIFGAIKNSYTVVIDGVETEVQAKYIYGYADIELTVLYDADIGKYYYLLYRDLTIDVNNNNLTLKGEVSDSAINPQNSVSFVLKNAKITSKAAKILYPSGAAPQVVFENLIFDWTAGLFTDYRAGGTFTANNCVFNFKASNGSHGFYLLKDQSKKLVMNFNDCTVNLPSTAKIANGFIRVADAAKTGADITVNFNGGTYDFGSSGSSYGIFSTGSNNASVAVNFNTADNAKPMYINTTVYPMVMGKTANPCAVTFGNNIYLANDPSEFVTNGTAEAPTATVKYADGLAWAETNNASYPNLLTNDYSDVIFNDGNKVTERRFAAGYTSVLGATYSYFVEKVGNVNKAVEKVTAWFDESGEIVTSFVPADGMILSGRTESTGKYALWAIFNEGETEVLQAGTTDILPAGIINAVGENCVLRLYTHVTYDHGTGTTVGGVTPGAGSTIDLGGCTLTLRSARFVSRSVSGSTYTVKNGTVDVRATGNNVLFSNYTNAGTTIFDGVTFVTKSGMMPFDFRGGSLVLSNCVFNQADSHFIAMASRTNSGGTAAIPISIKAVNCTVVCMEAFRSAGSTSGSPTPPYTPDVSIEVVGGTYDCAYFFTVGGGYTAASEYTIDLQGVSVKCSAGSVSSLSVDTKVDIVVDKDCKFTHDPAVGTIFNPDSVTAPAGLAVVPKANGEYAYTVGVPVFIKWNLTLYTDFDVNFLIDAKGINYVKINGVDYPLANDNLYDGCYVLTLKSVAANLAAEDITLAIGYGDGYSVTYTKSVVDYANALLASINTDLSKTLIATAMKYVGKAYEYANSEDGSSPDMPKALTDLLESEGYLAYLPAEDVALADNANKGNTGIAIANAQLNLASQLKFRFNLNPEYTGTLKIYGQSFNVSQGLDRATELSYVELEIRAFALYRDTIAISGTREDGVAFSGTYSLGTYIAGVKDTSTVETKDLLTALSTYVATASNYKNEKDMLNKFTYEKNGNTFVITGANGVSGDVLIPNVYEGLYVTEIAAYAFADNTAITSVVIPSSVKTVGIGAFKGCTSLTSVTLNEGLAVIGTLAFESTALESLVIPDSVQAIGQGILRNVNTITSVTLPFVGAYRSDSNEYFGYVFGAPNYVANIDYVPASLTKVVLSDACEEIPAYSFFGCTSVNNVVIGAGVKVIGISAFQGCSALKSIYIPATVTSIPAKGFFYNSPFFGCADGFTVVTESADLSAFGPYWCQLTENGKATVVTGLSYDEYIAQYK